MNRSTVHILLVEDNADHADLLLRQLEPFPMPLRFHQVEDGEAALDYIFGRHAFSDRAQFPAPDVVLLDWRLPRLNGEEVLRLLKTNPATAQLPVVVLTTSDAERDLAVAIELRADKFLTKPAERQTLLRLLAELGFTGGPVSSSNPGRPGASA